MRISFEHRLDLLQRMSRSWLDLKKAIDATSEVALVAPTPDGQRSGRDVMILVAIWDEELARVLVEMDSGLGENWPGVEGEELESWNETRIGEFSSIPFGDAREYFEEAHFELMDLAERSPSLNRNLVDPALNRYADSLARIRAIQRSTRDQP